MTSGNLLAQLALLGYPAMVLLLFALLPLRKAILTAMVGGWLFLPILKMDLAGLPDYDKIMATNCAIGLGCFLWARRELFALRPQWIDLPILLWCLAPSLSSLSNHLGLYDACAVGFRQVLVWLIPYGIGRAFFKDAASQKMLAVAFILGGLVYIPFCLLEIRLSPQLNFWVYGFHQNNFIHNVRYGGFRPVVFLANGLMLGMWMATATVMAFWLGLSGEKRIGRIPYPVIFATLLIITILCKALYAILLMLLALSLLLIARYGKTLVPVMLLLLAIPGYMTVRGLQLVSTETITQQAKVVFGEDRAHSLDVRLVQEDVIVGHAMKHPLFGWGGYRRSWPIDPFTGEFQLRQLDGLWTIVIGMNGFFGVCLLFLTLLAPVAAIVFRKQAHAWGAKEHAAREVLGISLLIFACDCILNGMFNPLFLLIAGGISWSPLVKGIEPMTIKMPRNIRHINGSDPVSMLATTKNNQS